MIVQNARCNDCIIKFYRCLYNGQSTVVVMSPLLIIILIVLCIVKVLTRYDTVWSVCGVIIITMFYRSAIKDHIRDAVSAATNSNAPSTTIVPPALSSSPPTTITTTESSEMIVTIYPNNVITPLEPTDSVTQCSICCDNIDETSKNVQWTFTDCGHKYHVECLTNWTKFNHTCPICRGPLKFTKIRDNTRPR